MKFLDRAHVIAAIAGLTILEALAILKGIDGYILNIVIAAIAGLGGFSIANLVRK